MKSPIITILVFLFSAVLCTCQSPSATSSPVTVSSTGGSSYTGFRPSLTIVVGIFTVMFGLVLFLLMYAKFCHISASDFILADTEGDTASDLKLPSGVDKMIIESLPFFRFSALRGSREGLECAVCLSRYEESDLLRLLPKCKHAFHMECVDKWLENHSTCPLCRSTVDSGDLSLRSSFSFSSAIASGGGMDVEGSAVPPSTNEFQLFVERDIDEEPAVDPKSKFGLIGHSLQRIRNSETAESPLSSVTPGAPPDLYHRFKHRIIFSDMVFQNRWSDVNATEIASLMKTQILAGAISGRSLEATPTRYNHLLAGSETPTFMTNTTDNTYKSRTQQHISFDVEAGQTVSTPIPELNNTFTTPTPSSPPMSETTDQVDDEGFSSTKTMLGSRNTNIRSMSEIAKVPRFSIMSWKARSSGTREQNSMNAKEEKLMNAWLPIARRTVQWFAKREKATPTETAMETTTATGREPAILF